MNLLLKKKIYFFEQSYKSSGSCIISLYYNIYLFFSYTINTSYTDKC